MELPVKIAAAHVHQVALVIRVSLVNFATKHALNRAMKVNVILTQANV